MSDMAVSTTLILFMGFAIVLVVLFGKVAADSHFFTRTSTGIVANAVFLYLSCHCAVITKIRWVENSSPAHNKNRAFGSGLI